MIISSVLCLLAGHDAWQRHHSAVHVSLSDVDIREAERSLCHRQA